MSDIYSIINDLRAEAASLRKEAKNPIYIEGVKDSFKYKAEQIENVISDLGMLYRDELYADEEERFEDLSN